VADDILYEYVEFVQSAGDLLLTGLLTSGLGRFVHRFVFLFGLLLFFFGAFAEPFGDPGRRLGFGEGAGLAGF